MEREAAPSAADIEHSQAGRKAKLGRYKALFGELSFFKILGSTSKVSAGILPVFIEEEFVKRTWQVIVMAHVALGPSLAVDLPGKARPLPEFIGNLHPGWKAILIEISGKQTEQIVDGPGLHRDASVHVSLSDSELGVKDKRARNFAIEKTDGDWFSRPVTEVVNITLPIANSELSGTDDRPQH